MYVNLLTIGKFFFFGGGTTNDDRKEPTGHQRCQVARLRSSRHIRYDYIKIQRLLDGKLRMPFPQGDLMTFVSVS